MEAFLTFIQTICDDIYIEIINLRGCSYRGELARLGRLAFLGEMILSHVYMESSISVQ